MSSCVSFFWSALVLKQQISHTRSKLSQVITDVFSVFKRMTWNNRLVSKIDSYIYSYLEITVVPWQPHFPQKEGSNISTVFHILTIVAEQHSLAPTPIVEDTCVFRGD